MQCSKYWATGRRCQRDAEVWLIQPDGKRNPGGYLCRNHGEAVVSEYAVILGEQWSLGPLKEALCS